MFSCRKRKKLTKVKYFVRIKIRDFSKHDDIGKGRGKWVLA